MLRRWFSLATKPQTLTRPSTTTITGRCYPVDDWTNVTDRIVSLTSHNLLDIPNHPLSILNNRIHRHLSSSLSNLHVIPHTHFSPVVSTSQNFDSLLIAKDHISRSRHDTYYINRTHLLRTHTSAHQVDVLRDLHHKNIQEQQEPFGFVLASDVYRRDEIDATHYPVFHQLEGVYVFPRSSLTSSHEPKSTVESLPMSSQHVQPAHSSLNINGVVRSLQETLTSLMRHVFEDQVEVRWVESTFPFTQPSWEMEVKYRGEWLEVCGCGVMRDEILLNAGFKDHIGWAFGLGLERIAMVMFDVPDIRLFWSQDDRFLSQFRSDKVTRFQPFSKYPGTYKDVSFWIDHEFHENNLNELVREVCGDLVESVKLMDEFEHPKTKKTSKCYRLLYRAMDRTLRNKEVDVMQQELCERLQRDLGVRLR